MQTYPTHIVLGATVAQAMLVTDTVVVGNLLGWLLVLASGVVGGMAPDLVMFPMFFWDKYVKKIQPMTEQGPVILFLKEISHSVVFWPIVTIFWIYHMPEGIVKDLGFICFICALFAGVFPDIFTHTEERFLDTDPTFCFPFSLLPAVRIRHQNPNWEYRKEHGDRSMKDWEKQFNILVLKLFTTFCILQLINTYR